VRRTACWNLAPEIPGYQNHLSVMDLLFGKLALLGYEGTELSRRHPAADTFALVAGQLAGVERVVRVELPGRPERYLFEVGRRGRDPLLVVWDLRDPFTGEDDPPEPFDWPWPGPPRGLRHPGVRHRRLTASPVRCPILGAWTFR
jgi:hypothetical protein